MIKKVINILETDLDDHFEKSNTEVVPDAAIPHHLYSRFRRRCNLSQEARMSGV